MSRQCNQINRKAINVGHVCVFVVYLPGDVLFFFMYAVILSICYKVDIVEINYFKLELTRLFFTSLLISELGNCGCSHLLQQIYNAQV